MTTNVKEKMMTTKPAPKLAEHLGLPMDAIFGLLLSASAMVFGPFVALQLPAPGSQAIWGATVVMVILGLTVTLKTCGLKVIIASLRKQPRFWSLVGAQFVLAVGAVLGFMGLLDRIF